MRRPSAVLIEHLPVEQRDNHGPARLDRRGRQAEARACCTEQRAGGGGERLAIDTPRTRLATALLLLLLLRWRLLLRLLPVGWAGLGCVA